MPFQTSSLCSCEDTTLLLKLPCWWRLVMVVPGNQAGYLPGFTQTTFLPPSHPLPSHTTSPAAPSSWSKEELHRWWPCCGLGSTVDTCPVLPTLTSRLFLAPCTLTPVTLHLFHMLGKRGVLMSWTAARYINGYHKERLSEFV